TVLCQTFTYSKGWTNGKRSEFPSSLGVSNPGDEHFTNGELRRLRMLVYGNVDEQVSFKTVPPKICKSERGPEVHRRLRRLPSLFSTSIRKKEGNKTSIHIKPGITNLKQLHCFKTIMEKQCTQ
ncbi:PREDICTED: uncharacterized protein LOC105461425, partial [Wasmannia auropunctata]|uniref:uncharacterized protein LOC105461425 n=1 Tax=Wasmannia auropunctata TaxID=64793 RepID=UPI0005ED89E6